MALFSREQYNTSKPHIALPVLAEAAGQRCARGVWVGELQRPCPSEQYGIAWADSRFERFLVRVRVDAQSEAGDE
jgi:hypothetical protein